MRIEVTYNLTDLRELAKQFPDVVMAEAEAVMDLIVRRLEKDVVELTPRGVGAQGGLAGSVFGESATVGQRVTGIVGTPIGYGDVVEEGRGGGRRMPPVDALIPWVRSKLGITDEKEQKSIAYAIARKIQVYGTDGAHMFAKAWDKDERWVQDQLRSIGPRVVKRIEQ